MEFDDQTTHRSNASGRPPAGQAGFHKPWVRYVRGVPVLEELHLSRSAVRPRVHLGRTTEPSASGGVRDPARNRGERVGATRPAVPAVPPPLVSRSEPWYEEAGTKSQEVEK